MSAAFAADIAVFPYFVKEKSCNSSSWVYVINIQNNGKDIN